MRIRIVDAFTDRPFAGNPAAVCVLDGPEWPEERWMRRVAAELNLSETAYVRRLAAEGGWALRWFTPTEEAALCGHATLATVHALRADGLVADGEWARFATMSGELLARPEADGSITLDFPANPPQATETPAGLAEALGAEVLAAYGTGELGDLLVVLRSEHTVRGLRPDLTAIANLPIRGVIATAAADDPAGPYEFVSRFFGPACGIPEDPVTGSAHTALAPYWAERLGRTELTGYQASPRGGSVRCELNADRVLLSGRAVTVLDGALTPPAAG
ncbi:Oxidoreductase [Kitasatospora sp. MMS16-BH015]|uniref:PhzF family phenazine biosynthesis protein n=1 Tax=Kitasatospora sp. MMS16-BH015 TaxID=2018025 RepID=UPI000CA2C27C|nr:PhzF family phenazine biosynthesis protein [Kitasatospora sp. MMS16-BH015]AUG81430.1 Oxidoreductase [Kitasatospora sp. MMS16-BH015]